MTLPGKPRHIFVHQPSQAFDACHQTELPEALRQLHKRMHIRGGRQSRRDVVVVFMALLPFGFNAPGLRLGGSNATSNQNFNRTGDIPTRTTENLKKRRSLGRIARDK